MGISCENGVQSWPSRESKPAEKTAHRPSGIISGVLPRVELGPGHAGSAKLTLGRTSEMTPDGWCTVFSAGLDSGKAKTAHRFHRKSPNWPKWPKITSKRGGPPFLHGFYLSKKIIEVQDGRRGGPRIAPGGWDPQNPCFLKAPPNLG